MIKIKKDVITKYKNSMVNILGIKYGISEFEARKWIREYDFNSVLRKCNYIDLHDDPEIWVDEIYQWAKKESR